MVATPAQALLVGLLAGQRSRRISWSVRVHAALYRSPRPLNTPCSPPAVRSMAPAYRSPESAERQRRTASECLRNRGVEIGWRLDISVRVVDPGGADGPRGSRRESPLARKNIGADADAVQVAIHLLGRRVSDGAHHMPRAGQPTGRSSSSSFREAEVDKAGIAEDIHEDVRRLEVAVDDAPEWR